MKKCLILILILLIFELLTGTEISFGPRIDRGMLQNDEITEASGLTVSGWDSGVLWAHNDSGGETAIYALSVYGEHLGKYFPEGINFRDVEDIASGAGPETNEKYLYLADVGDNLGIYTVKYIYRIREPEVSGTQNPEEVIIPAEDIEVISFSYPGTDKYDAETIFIENLSKDIYIVTKRNPENPYSGNEDIVYRLEYPQSTSSVIVVEEVANLGLASYQEYGITGGDLSSSGLELLLKTYDKVYYWGIEPGEELASIFDESAVEVHYEIEPQGEALCWSGADDAYFSCGEEYGGYPSHLGYYARYSSFIQISQLPAGLYKSNETIEIIWSPGGLYNQLYLSTGPGGEILENYEASGVWGEDILITTPMQLGLSVGVYRGILHNPEYDYLSIEFPLIVESSSAVQMVYPANGNTISDPLPVFQWQVNPGVPYYLIGISDTPFIIEHDENGETVVTGIETVWQAITYETSLMYGMPDPSGYFGGNAPPLIAGQEYNWIVANNYGNDPLMTSKVAGSPFSFYYSAEETIESVNLISPAEGIYINGGEINFIWTEVNEAMYYQVQVFEIRQEGSNIGNYLVWEQVTTNTDIDMNAESILIAAEYNWKVYVTSAEEVSSVSESRHFTYDIAVGTLSLHVRDNYGSAVSFARAELDPIEGSSDDFPLAVNEGGNETKTIPVGEYILEISKEGYEPADTVFTISEGAETSLWVVLEYSPSYFYGRVTDIAGYNINNVTITAESDEGERREITSINGNYLAAVTPGEWTLTAEKRAWICLDEVTTVIEPGESLQLADIQMSESGKDIQGYVHNTGGLPLMRCHVEALSEGKIRRSITDANGYYQFEGVNYGAFTITAVKPGYTALNEGSANITAASPAVTNVQDLILQPSAMINGTSRNGLVGLKEVVITAIPSIGNPVETLTDEYGDYQLNLVAGTYYIGAYKVHYTNQTTYQVSLNTGETLDNLDFILLPNNAHIRGTVISEGNGLGAVRISAGENITYTEENGDYELIVYPGTYNISAFREGYTPNRNYRLSLAPDEIMENIDFVLYPNASVINGMVHHEGVSIAAASVYAKKQTGNQAVLSETSNYSGRYSFSLLHGSYKLWSEKTNFVCLPEDTVFVMVAPGEVLENVDINLTPVEAYIDGRVINNQGLGIEGADLEVIAGENYYFTISGNYGNFSVVVEPGYDYTVLASKPGYSSGAAQTGILEIGDHTDLEIILTQLPSTISGRVYNQNGISIQGATVIATGENTYTTSSSLNGTWLLSIFAGTYEVTAAKPGYIEDSREITLVPGTHLDSLDFYLEENFAILEGNVINQNTDEPLSEVLITATYNGGGGNSGYTNINGFYRLEDLLPGVYESIIYTKLGYYSHIEANRLLPGNFTTNIDVFLEPYEAAIRSMVTYEGEGIGGATVAAENLTSGEVVYDVTDDQGISLIEELASLLPYEVSVSLQNYASTDTIVYLVPGDTLELSFELIRIDGMIFGFIRDQENDPVVGATIFATSEDGYEGSAVSVSNGAYVVENLAVNRNYHITVIKTGYSQGEVIDVFLTEEPYNLDVIIYEHNLSVEGILVDQAEIILPGIQVNCQGQITGDQTQSGTDGSFVLEPLAPFSTYTFWTIAAENGYENISWEDSLETSDLDLGEVIVPVHISIIQGIITDLDTGEPIEGVMVTADDQAGGQTSGAVSQPDGSYRIRYLYEGSYTIQAIKNSYATLIIDNIDLGHREELQLDFTMEYNQPVVISGQVRDTDNRPYENITVNMIIGSTIYTEFTDINGSFLFTQGMPYSEIIITTGLNPSYYDNDWVELITTIENITDILLEIDVHNAGLNGQITDDGAGLSNVEVSLTSVDSSYTMITGLNGFYNFEYLYEGLYELSCYRPGYELYATTLQLNDGDIISLNIALQQIEGAISGIVRSAQEAGLKNAIVTARYDNQIMARDTTHASGAFQLDELPAGLLYEISVSKTGFINYIHPDLVAVDDENLELILSPIANSLSGTVYYEGMEMPEATVVIRNQDMEMEETETNGFGDYLFSNISGYRDVWAVYGDEYTSISEGVNVPVGGAIRFYPELIDAASIEGLTLYLGNLKPGVTVTATNIASGRWARDITEEDGLYELIGLPAGNYNVIYYCEGYAFHDLPGMVTLVAGEDIILSPVNMTFMQNSISGIVQRINTRIGISNASVILSDSLHIVLDEFITEVDGTFLFSPLADGRYYVNVSHPAYHEIEEIEVELANGVSEPPTVDFNLVPKELNIYGYVRTDGGIPVFGAVVEVERIDLKLSKHRVNKSKIKTRSFADTTDTSGYYEVAVDTVGFWQITVDCAGYYPAQPVTVEIGWDQLFYQQNFYLQHIVLYADICGSVRIWDESWQAAESFQVRLRSLAGIDTLWQSSTPDTAWCFENLVIPDIFSLEVSAEYSGESFYERRDNIAIEQEQVWTEDFTFTYIPETYTWFGNIYMQDTAQIPLAEAGLVLENSSGDSLFSDTNTEGYYNFGNLGIDDYRLHISVEYNNELFHHKTAWFHLSQNHNYSYIFQYLLAELGIYIRRYDTLPLPNTNIQLSGAGTEIDLTTNPFGYCTSGAVLHTGIYDLEIIPPYNLTELHLSPQQQRVEIDTLGFYQFERSIPLWLDKDDYSASYNYDAEIPVYLYKTEDYTGTATFYYRSVNNSLHQLIMYVDENRYYQTIPAQQAAGEIEFWFRVVTSEAGTIYSNAAYPYLLDISTAGIPSIEYSAILPENPVLPYNSEIDLSLLIRDELGNELNAEIAAQGEVVWYLENEEMGILTMDVYDPLIAHFQAASLEYFEITDQITAEIDYEVFHLNLHTNLTIGNYHIAEIRITGPNEISNKVSASCNVRIYSQSGRLLSLPFTYQPIPAYAGILQGDYGSILYTPENNFLGRTVIGVSVVDPQEETVFSQEFTMIVYDVINTATSAGSLTTGEGCDLLVYDNMLKNTQNQAKVYLLSQSVPPYEAAGVQYETCSPIFKPNSDQSETAFQSLPGLEFTDAGQAMVARWDEENLSWQILNEESEILEHIDIFAAHYSAIKSSDELGIYDLKLLPNPFTPHDMIGSNMGLQIQFRLSSPRSRYINITARIYTMTGQLVREITRNQPMLKGEYEAGAIETLYWDGYTDGGKMARNGRYLIHLIAEDSGKKKELLKSIVLIK